MGVTKSRGVWCLDYRLKDFGGKDCRGTRIKRKSKIQSKRGAEAELAFVQSKAGKVSFENLAEQLTSRLPFSTMSFPEKQKIILEGLQQAYECGLSDGVEILNSIIFKRSDHV